MGTRNDSQNPILKSSYSHYISVRQKLDDLGYDNFLSNESVTLVDRLLCDLLHWKRGCAENKEAAEQWKRVNTELRKESTNGARSDCNPQFENHCQNLEQMVLSEKKLNAHNVKGLAIENSKLLEKIEDMKFVLAQNAEQIRKLSKENFSKSQIILQLDSEKPESCIQNEQRKSLGSQRPKPHIEKPYDLPQSNLSKIQSLYKQILSASEDPAIVDWVKACEVKIKNMEQEIDCTNKALEVTQNMCDNYQKKMVHCETENGLLKAKIGCNGTAQLKSKLEQMERENKNLQSQLSEAIGKQHEAMSRAIMLAGSRKLQSSAAPPPKSNAAQLLEKKVTSLESESKVLKQTLTSTQKERDSFLKEINRLHSQEATLMTEIRSLNTELKQQQQQAQAADSGIGSTEARDSCGEDSSKQEKWLKQLSEQRQRYYENVQQLQACIRNRQPLTFQCQCPQQPDRIHVNCATQTEKDSGPTRAAGSQVPMSSEEDCMDRLPHQFQNWARSLLDERKTLKEQNSLLKNNSSLSGEQLQNFQAKLNSSMDQLRQTERTKLRLENDLDNVNTKLLNVERELTQERAKNQQMRLDIEDADTIAASWNKKFSEKSGQLESNKNRCSELETQVFQLQEQIASLQGQLRSLQVHRSQKETENRHQLDEMDAANARVKQLEKQLSIKQENLMLMQANLQAYESKMQRLEQESSKQQSQAEMNQRQNHRLSEEIDQIKLNNTALRIENERLVSSMASLHVDLDREHQGAENLQREVRSYVSRVQQVETLLAQKDEERTALLQQFQALTNESSNNENEREKMEQTLRSHQKQTSCLEKELNNVRRRLGEMEQLYGQQRSNGVEIEIQAEDLACRMTVLERDLKESNDDKMRLQQQLLSANNLQQSLEKQLERLRMEAAQTDSQSHMRELESTRLQDEVQIMEQRLFKERESARSLESVVTVLRQERVQQDNQFRSLSLDLSRLQQRGQLLQEKLANSKADLSSCEGKLLDLSNETQQLKQQVLQEKFEKEKTRQELKKMASLCQTPSATSPAFNPSPTPVVGGYCRSTLSSASTTRTATHAFASPRRKLSVAERLCQAEI